ncbi:hypothetical protein [Dactylosporangium sp. NPDC051541]|uniref:hypothetical protein n=1 Tax=Dactylosporangium sp. NPDC051541 TaxID=3363977 RepID=UPI0037A52083
MPRRISSCLEAAVTYLTGLPYVDTVGMVGEATTITVYSETEPDAANYRPAPGADDYYLNPARGNVPEYRNELDVASWEHWHSFEALRRASSVTTPTIVVHSDQSALPGNARKLYEAVQGPKELVWSDGNHFDYYDSPTQMDNAVANVTRFFRTHLAA